MLLGVEGASHKGGKRISKYAHYILSLLILSVGVITVAVASAQPRIPPQVKFNPTLQDQLEKLGYINSIHQDADGFLWFAAVKGLARYDGYTLRTYEQRVDDPLSISHLWVKHLLRDSRGDLWAVTHTGLCRYLRTDDGFQCFPGRGQSDAVPNLYFYYLFEDSRQQMWASTSLGIRLFNPSNGALSLAPEPLNSTLTAVGNANTNSVNTVAEAPNGDLWFGLEGNGLIRYSPPTHSLIHYHLNDDHSKLQSNQIRSILADSNGVIWIGTLGAGIARFNEQSGEFERFLHSASEKADTVWDIMEDQNGLFWIGDGTGVHLYNPDTGDFADYSYIEGQTSGPSNFVARDIFMDKSNGIWIGYFPSGVDAVDLQASEFLNFRHMPEQPNSLGDGGVLTTLEAPDKTLWIGCGFGLSHLDRATGNFTKYIYEEDDPHSLSGSTVLDMELDRDHILWVGAWDRGLNRQLPGEDRWERYQYDPQDPKSLYGREPWGITVDHNNDIWIVTEKGINRYNRSTNDFTRVMPNDSLGNPMTTLYSRGITTMSDGRLWIASYNGVYVLNPDTLEFEAHYMNDPEQASSISWNQILTSFQDSKGNIWVGTFGGGLNKFNHADNTFTRFTTQHGLPNSTVSSIVEDTEGNLWVSTFEGLARFDPKTQKFMVFTKRDGLVGNLFNRDSGSLLSDGSLVFGSSRGLTLFDPHMLQPNEHIPPIVLTDLQIFNESQRPGPDSPLQRAIGVTQEISLDHTQSVFSIAYSALDFRSPDENQYAYRLKGFEERWNMVGNRRLATYTNLDPGNYVFEVKGSNNHGIWNPTPARLRIYIAPPYWRTPLAYAFYALALSALISWTLWVQRKELARERALVRRMTEIDRMKDEINRDLDRKVADRTEALRTEHQRLIATQEELRSLNKRLEDASLTDQLTGLHNRRFLYNTITSDLIETNEQYDRARTAGLEFRALNDLTFMVLDIDDFKSINDHHGHASGDLMLVQFGNILRSALAAEDYVIRWGGEEFVLVIRHQARSRAEAIADRLLFTTQNHTFKLADGCDAKKTCSIGIASYPFAPNQPGLFDWEQIISLADQALYAAKASGKNCWVRLQANDRAGMRSALEDVSPTTLSGGVTSGAIKVTSSRPMEELQWRD
ncbi:two-component regulator propeller domain-containing protein [Teredinibacter turnerae]|uniref:ligand-binding sensor domain-containing protein n=1 Tax=Teredinibacter turnerae TaxID=2426 RepID=UPI00040CF35B|nr:two-component regulator propeller domain-containing protein [Teredinibacter turnerae]